MAKDQQAAVKKKADKNRPVLLCYDSYQKGYDKNSAPEQVVIVYQGQRIEIPFGSECPFLMPFRIAQHYVAKTKNWGSGKGEGNGAVLSIAEVGRLREAKGTATSSPSASGNAGSGNAAAASDPGVEEDFDLEAASYPALKDKALELGIELPGNISKVDLKAKIAEALAPKA